MSQGTSLPYQLRPNKAVDRELFLALLSRLTGTLPIESYRYVGLGGPFLEDFRLIHARLGIDRMTCVERDQEVHERQKFNRPVNCVECVHDSLEDYMDAQDLDEPVIIWLDYTNPARLVSQLGRFRRLVGEVATNSILRITMNAHPSGLGEHPDGDCAAEVLLPWRVQRLRERLGDLFPQGLSSGQMTRSRYGAAILLALRLAVDRELLSYQDREVVWALATHYADGQPMVTATVVVVDKGDSRLADIVQSWEFRSVPEDPHLIDMPQISARERLAMELGDDVPTPLRRSLPKSPMGSDPVEVFRRFYRVFPHFSRVEL